MSGGHRCCTSEPRLPPPVRLTLRRAAEACKRQYGPPGPPSPPETALALLALLALLLHGTTRPHAGSAAHLGSSHPGQSSSS